jgi:transcriptional regulator with XRE-family HTH domain
VPSGDIESPLGEFIRRQRELQKLSMRQLAELAGISNPYLSQIERGLRDPSEKVIDAIARNLEVSADALYERGGRRIAGDDDPREDAAVVAAIKADPGLTARQRSAMLEVYTAFTSGRSRPRRGDAASAGRDAQTPRPGEND